MIALNVEKLKDVYNVLIQTLKLFFIYVTYKNNV